MNTPIETADQKLRARARRVIPGGMFGHMRSDTLPAGYPQFFERAKGATFGTSMVDATSTSCAVGDLSAGPQPSRVTEAVQRQMSQGDCMDGPSERMVELAERLVRLLPHADWAMFAKNGTDATTTCVMLARAATGRRKILAAQGAYHGAVPWCSPHPLGVTAEDRAHLIYYVYNDIRSLEAAIDSAGADLAGVIVSAFRHDYGFDQEMPNAEFAKRARALCDEKGAALILDDVRAGFRLSLHGSWDLLGVQPDLSSWSKAIANGYALAAVTGSDRFARRALRRSS